MTNETGARDNNLSIELKILDMKYIVWGEMILVEHYVWNDMFEDALKQIDKAESMIRMILNAEGDKYDGGDVEQSESSQTAN